MPTHQRVAAFVERQVRHASSTEVVRASARGELNEALFQLLLAAEPEAAGNAAIKAAVETGAKALDATWFLAWEGRARVTDAA